MWCVGSAPNRSEHQRRRWKTTRLEHEEDSDRVCVCVFDLQYPRAAFATVLNMLIEVDWRWEVGGFKSLKRAAGEGRFKLDETKRELVRLCVYVCACVQVSLLLGVT